MKRQLIHLSLLSAFCSGLFGGEHKLSSEDFEKVVTLEGVLMPESAKTLRIEPEAWESYPVLSVLPHASLVGEGEVVVNCDPEALDRKISEEEAAKKIRKLDLQASRLQLADLEKTTPKKLAAAERAFQRAEEDLAYFQEIGRAVQEEAAELSVDRAKRGLEYQTEELEQLLKMYAEDDLTEETEEIILKRQRSAVKDAKQYLARTIISKEKTLKTKLPREHQDLTEKFENARLVQITTREELPRALQKKRLEVKAVETAHRLADEALADLHQDRALMKISAPISGHLYYGELINGSWSVGQTVKYLKRGAKIPKHINIATIVPQGAKLHAEAVATEEQVGTLEAGLEGFFSPSAAPRQRIKGKVVSLAKHPDLSGNYPLVFSFVDGAKGFVTGMKGQITLVTEAAQNVITIPLGALTEESDGTFSVKVKMAEKGAAERRAVTLGPETKEKVIILSGLEAGEIVIIGNGEDKE